MAPSSSQAFSATFTRLRRILADYAARLTVVSDTAEGFHLDTRHIMPNKGPLFFGAVHVKKSFVSFHLMPVYVFPELLEGASSELRDRMHGKSCFNFKKLDEPLAEELSELTAKAFKRYEQAGYV
ncbi:MAG TPA: hypothetical protein VJ011_10000 [Steroidobacteraceae bacterium]|nr:hypothetical protein [Steroidobacteraceae bacterium]